MVKRYKADDVLEKALNQIKTGIERIEEGHRVDIKPYVDRAKEILDAYVIQQAELNFLKSLINTVEAVDKEVELMDKQNNVFDDEIDPSPLISKEDIDDIKVTKLYERLYKVNSFIKKA